MTGFRGFQGKGYKFVGGLKQSATNRGNIRMSLTSVGWDKVYSRLTAIPPNIKITLKQASNKNAERIAAVAREYVPHGLETDKLHDSIEPVQVQEKGTGGWMSSVKANTPYAHYVEMGVHPRGAIHGSRQGPPQGSHFMERAMQDTLEESQENIRQAVSKGINKAIKTATRKGGLDFSTGKGKAVAPFVQSAMDAGFVMEVGESFGGITPLGMDYGGF